MKKGFRQKEIKFPENRKIAATFLPGDRVTIALYSGMSVYTIRDMSLGYRRINDRVARAIIRLMNERKELGQALNEIVNQ